VKCPYCGFRFRALAANAAHLPSLAPIVCESCARVGLLENGRPRTVTDAELEALKQAPVWQEFIEPALELIERERGKRS
jgi:hypothetical protein